MRECHLAAEDVEDRRSENTCHVTDLRGHRRLCQPQFIRRPSEAPVVCDRQKNTEVMDGQPAEVVPHDFS